MESDQIVRCGICMEDYNKQHVSEQFETLLCSHQVCNSCFLDLVKFNKHICPYCRTPFYPIVNSNLNRICDQNFDDTRDLDDYSDDMIDMTLIRQNRRRRRRRHNNQNQSHIGNSTSVPIENLEPIFSINNLTQSLPIDLLPVKSNKSINDKGKQKLRHNKNNHWNYLKNNFN